MKQRDTSLDIIRISACIMVVFMHSPMPSDNASGPFLTALSYITAPSIGLFFMVSGALLLPVKTDYVTFLRKRFSKILIPTLLWSLIYIGLKLYESESEINVLKSLASLPFAPQGEGVLWFMYTLSGLYLLSPILSAWIEKAGKGELQIVLLIWCITLCYPLISFYVTIDTTTAGIFYYFTGYAGYFLLGAYLRKYPGSLSLVALWALGIGGAVLLLVLKYLDIPFDFYSLFWYESIFIVALATAIWKLIYKICNSAPGRDLTRRMGQQLGRLSNMTFGIYLIHILIMRHWLWHQAWIQNISGYSLQCVVIAVLTFVISAVACRMISILPQARWIIGYTEKKKSR